MEAQWLYLKSMLRQLIIRPSCYKQRYTSQNNEEQALRIQKYIVVVKHSFPSERLNKGAVQNKERAGTGRALRTISKNVENL